MATGAAGGRVAVATGVAGLRGGGAQGEPAGRRGRWGRGGAGGDGGAGWWAGGGGAGAMGRSGAGMGIFPSEGAGSSEGVGLATRYNQGSRKEKEKPTKKKGPKSFHCKDFVGHIRREFPEWKKANASSSVAASSDNDSDDDMLTLSSERSNEAWILDTMRSYHVTPNKEWFVANKSDGFGVVFKGDDVP
nr:translation initiation factor IF-2-like [Aegilops tauschii subsp. strangulata]